MLSQFVSPAHLPWTVTIVLVMALAVWRGASEERLAANALLIGWLLTKLVYRYKGGQTEWGILAVDLGLLAVLIWIAMRSRRYWPLFAASFHLLAVVTHLAKAADPTVGGWAYITAGIMWSYLLAVAIGYGAWTASGRQLARTDDPNDPAGATRR